jgi:hypothetical protein
MRAMPGPASRSKHRAACPAELAPPITIERAETSLPSERVTTRSSAIRSDVTCGNPFQHPCPRPSEAPYTATFPGTERYASPSWCASTLGSALWRIAVGVISGG